MTVTAVERIVIVGASNDGELVVDLLDDINRHHLRFEVVGFLDDDVDKQGRLVNRHPVLGPVSRSVEFAGTCKFVVVVASAKKTSRTRQIIDTLNLPADRFPILVHPLATVSHSARLGPGCIVMAGVRVNSRVVMGRYVMVEGNAWLGVGTRVEDYAIVTHDASVSGDSVIGEGAYIGANCSIIGKTKIGAGAVVGMGAVVLADVPPRAVVVGNPARQVGVVDEVLVTGAGGPRQGGGRAT